MKHLRLLVALLALLTGVGNLSAQTQWTSDVTNGDGLSFAVQYANPTTGDVRETWSNNPGSFDLNQSFTGIPEGVYELSAQAMYRASFEYGTPTNCVLYASVGDKTYSTPIANFGDYTANNNLAQIGQQMTNNGAYTNIIPCIIIKNGTVTIGMKNIGELTFCDNGYWFVWKNSTFSFKNVTESYHAKLLSRANSMLALAPESDAKDALNTAVANYATATANNVEELQNAINTFLGSATASNPINVTSYLANPSFEEGGTTYWYQDLGYNQGSNRNIQQPTGWNLMYSSEKVNNTQFQSFISQTDGAKDGSCLYVRHRWGDVKAIEDLRQSVKELPSGAYTLTVAVKGGSNVSDANTLTLTAGDNTNTITISNFNKTNYQDYSVSVNKDNDESTLDICYGWKQTAGNEQLYYVDDIRLFYLGDPVKAKIAELAALEATISEYLNNEEFNNVAGSERNALLSYSRPSVDDETVEAYQTLIENLQTTINAFVNAKPAYDIFATYNKELEYANQDKKPVIDNTTTATTLISALRAYYESHALAEGVEGAVNMTEKITNATDPTNNDVWTWTGSKNNPASNEPWTDAAGTNTHSYFDGGDWGANSWTTTMSQDVTLAPGKYLLTAKARASENVTFTMSVGDASVELPHIGSTGNVFERGWGDASVEFETDGLAASTILVSASTQNHQHEWFSISDFRLVQIEASTLSDEVIQALIATIPTGKMNAEVKATMDAAKTTLEAEKTTEAYNALSAAITAANNSIAAYAHAKEELDKMVAELEGTNVYTAEAYKTHITDNLAAYEAGTLTDEAALAIMMLAGWHAANTIDDVLISAWDAEPENWDGLHVNTWSADADFEETGFKVPLAEYWVGSGSLPAKTMTATVSGLEAGNYKVSANMFIHTTSLPAGISMQVGEAPAVTITGAQSGSFYVSEATAFGAVGDDGNLVIKLIVADGNNTNWIGFKNMKYEKVNIDYAALNTAIANANAMNATIANGVKALIDAIATAQEALQATTQDEVDAATEALTAATETAKTFIAARKNLAGVAKKAEALKTFLTEDISEAIAEATDYVANAEATVEEANAKAEALNANFAAWTTVELANATFDTGLNGALVEPATEEKPYIHAVDGWTPNFTFKSTASQGIAADYGSAAQNGTNGTAAPATDMYGKSEGGTLHLSSGWSDQARYYQTIETLPAGKYVFYYEGFNANNTTNTLNSNYFGISELAAGSLEGTQNTFAYSEEKSFAYNEWKASAFTFTLTRSAENARINVGVVGGTASSSTTPKMWFDNVTIYCISTTQMATAEDYAALNTAIEAAEAKTLGFNEGEFAPYNNVEAIKALAMAKAIDQEAENPKTDVEAAINAIADDKWTANTEEVNAVYDGDWALTPANATSGVHEIKGWTNSGVMRLVLKDMSTYPGLADASKNAAVFTWGSNAISYGNETGYTMPLLADGVYKLEIKVAGWNNGAVGNVNVSVLNEESGLAATDLGGSQKAINQEGSLVSYSKIFKTGEAGNYILTLQANANFVFTDLIIKKAVVEDVTIDEAETYTPTEKYANVTFKRTLVEGWNGLVVPFDMTVEDAKTKFNATAVKDFESVSYDSEKGATLNFVDAAEIKAGRPFMLKAAAGTEYTFDGVLLKSNALQPISKENGNAKYTMTGTYEKVDLTNVNFVLIQGDKYYQHNTNKRSSAKAFRAYFVNGSTGEAASKGINFDFGEETNGISLIEDAQNSKNGNIYNLQGQKVNHAQKGVYIVNGKKVVVK